MSDYILERIAKLNTERIYYNQFVDSKIQVRNVEAQIQVVHGMDVRFEKILKTVRQGYPDADATNGWRADYLDLKGEALIARVGGGSVHG